SCPICGMALEAVGFAAGGIGAEEEDPEVADHLRRLAVGAILGVPALLLSMGPWGHGRGAIPPRLALWLECALATPVVLWSGLPLRRKGLASARARSPNMFTLIGTGVGAAYLFSLAATLAPSAFPSTYRGAGGAIPVYFESAVGITLLVLLGQVLE